MKKYLAGIISVSLLAAPAQAGRLSFEALPQEGVSTVQWLGSPKMIQQRGQGRVSVVPRGVEQGRLAFDVEVHNLSDRAAFFGQDSVEVRTPDQALGLASAERVDRAARNKSTWTRIGVGLVMVALIGVAAAAAGAAPSAGRNFIYTPPLRRDPAASAPPPSSSEQAVPDATSVPSRYLYSGRIFVERPKGALRHQQLSLLVNFNGEQYPFAYRVNDSR